MNTFGSSDPLLSALEKYEKEVCPDGLPFTTPRLLVDKNQLQKNIDRMNDLVNHKLLCPNFRPHLKTVKSAAFASMMTAGHTRAVCVSTVAEIDYFARFGYTDIMYCVGFAPSKTHEVMTILDKHPELKVRLVLDSVDAVTQLRAQIMAYQGREVAKAALAKAEEEAEKEFRTSQSPLLIHGVKSPRKEAPHHQHQAYGVIDAAQHQIRQLVGGQGEGNTQQKKSKNQDNENLSQSERISVLIEIDVGHGRGGMPSTSEELIPTAKAIAAGDGTAYFQFGGVVTHGGHGYGASSDEAHQDVCQDELRGISLAVKRLKSELNLDCPIVSVGSTPTLTHHGSVLEYGVTEVRAGVYPLMDLDQFGIGSCESVDDIAMTVLATVIGHNKSNGRLIIDAGGLALSKDISASKHTEMQPTGYGWIAGFPELYVGACSQEHGMIMLKPNLVEDPKDIALRQQMEGDVLEGDFSRPLIQSDDELFAKFPVGTRLRIIPNHACITASGHDHYLVVDPEYQNLSGVKDSVQIWTRLCGYSW